MSFRLLLLETLESADSLPMVRAWPERLRAEIAGITVHLCADEAQAGAVIGQVDAAYGKIGPALFAAAPDLLEALKKAQRCINYLLPDDIEDEDIPYEVLVPIKQAIAKAEGKE